MLLTILAMCTYALSMSISPGPVNMVSFSAGAGYGFRKTLPFVSGAATGFTFLLAAVGLGMVNVVNSIPFFYMILKYLGASFICYMGYKIINSQPEFEFSTEKPPNFQHGFIMQWLNPKAWIASLAGIAAFDLGNSIGMLLLFIGIYFCVCYPSLAMWAFLGCKIKIFLKLKRDIRIFNSVMGGLLIVTSIYLLVWR